MSFNLQTFILIAGLAHMGLCAGSLFIPRALNWKAELSGLRPLFRQMFWNYAAYIVAVNFFFGLISLAAPAELLNGSRLALLTTGLVALYWIGRVLVQFFYFDKTGLPTGPLYRLGEAALVALFVFFSVVYSLAFFYNLN